jgi:hypothetical protein
MYIKSIDEPVLYPQKINKSGKKGVDMLPKPRKKIKRSRKNVKENLSIRFVKKSLP